MCTVLFALCTITLAICIVQCDVLSATRSLFNTSRNVYSTIRDLYSATWDLYSTTCDLYNTSYLYSATRDLSSTTNLRSTWLFSSEYEFARDHRMVDNIHGLSYSFTHSFTHPTIVGVHVWVTHKLPVATGLCPGLPRDLWAAHVSILWCYRTTPIVCSLTLHVVSSYVCLKLVNDPLPEILKQTWQHSNRVTYATFTEVCSVLILFAMPMATGRVRYVIIKNPEFVTSSRSPSLVTKAGIYSFLLASSLPFQHPPLPIHHHPAASSCRFLVHQVLFQRHNCIVIGALIPRERINVKGITRDYNFVTIFLTIIQCCIEY